MSSQRSWDGLDDDAHLQSRTFSPVSHDSDGSDDSIPIILGYDSSLKEYEQQAAVKVAALLLALDDKMYRDGPGPGLSGPSRSPSPVLSDAESPVNLYSLERRHNFETHNRPQVANRKPQPSEWTRHFPYFRIRGFGLINDDVMMEDDQGWSVTPTDSLNPAVPPQTPVADAMNPLRAEVNSVLPWYGLPPSGCAGLLMTGRPASVYHSADTEPAPVASHGVLDEEVFAMDDGSQQRCYSDVMDVFRESPQRQQDAMIGEITEECDGSVLAATVSEIKVILLDALWNSVVHAMEPAVHAVVNETIADFTAAVVLPKRVSSRNVHSYHPVMPAFEEENSSDFSEEDTPTSVRVQSRLGANRTPFVDDGESNPLNASSSLVVTLPVPPLALPTSHDPHVQSSVKTSPADLQTLLSPVVVQRRISASTPVPPLTPVVIAPIPASTVVSKEYIRVTPTPLVLSPRKPSPSPRMSPVLTGFHRAPSPVALPSPKHSSNAVPSKVRPLAVPPTPSVSHPVDKPSPRDRTPSVERDNRSSPMSRHRRAKQGKLKVLISEDGEEKGSRQSSASPSLLIGPPSSTASARSRPTPNSTRIARQPITKRTNAVSPRTLAMTSLAVNLSSHVSLGDGEGVTGVCFSPKRRGRVDAVQQVSSHQARVASAKALMHKRQSSLTGLWASSEGVDGVSKRPITADSGSEAADVTEVPLPRSAHRKARIVPTGGHAGDTLDAFVRVTRSESFEDTGSRAQTALPRLRVPSASNVFVTGKLEAFTPTPISGRSVAAPTQLPPKVSPRTTRLQAAATNMLATTLSPRSHAISSGIRVSAPSSGPVMGHSGSFGHMPSITGRRIVTGSHR